MPLNLEQYADYLDTRKDLFWPAPPEVQRPKARPHLAHLPDVRAVTWSVYGTLLNIAGGELYREHPEPFIMDVALDKTIQEFKMWKAMTRKPGQPAACRQRVAVRSGREHVVQSFVSSAASCGKTRHRFPFEASRP